VDDAVATVLRDEAVRAASSMHAGELAIAGSRMPVVAFRDSDRPVGATVVSGRLPASPDEVAFGRTTLRRLGIGVGDRVSVGSDMGTLDATVVGQVVLPAVGTYSGADKTSLGEGAVIDASLLDPFESLASIVVQLDPGADPADLEERLATALSDFGVASLDSSELPSEVRSLEALAAFPRWLTLVLAALVGVPVAHSLVVSVRARRHDLAVMAALGARPRTLRGIGTLQGFTVVIAAALVGVPLGVLLGRWSWSALAASFGTVPEPVVPLGSVAVLTLAVLALGGLVGTVPVWRASRRTTLSSLRPE
jgi:predicted lysophospholipase L1 biosynthesis ABC-type transport system permease subunit